MIPANDVVGALPIYSPATIRVVAPFNIPALALILGTKFTIKGQVLLKVLSAGIKL